MLRIIPALLLSALLLVFTPSCKQCTECHKYPGKPVELCKKDFATEEAYTAAYRLTVSQGYDCD